MRVAGNELRVGQIPAEPLATAHGTIQVEAWGLILETPWGGGRWLRPYRATLSRPDERLVAVPVRDGSGRVLLALAAAALLVLLVANTVLAKWGRPA